MDLPTTEQGSLSVLNCSVGDMKFTFKQLARPASSSSAGS